MRPQNVLILIGCVLGSTFGACGKGKSYPTAPAPETLKQSPMNVMKATGDDIDLDDYDDSDVDTPRPSSRKSTGRTTARSQPGRPMGVRSQAPVMTINGHPKGPLAAVFNAVVNNAYTQAASCFANLPAKATSQTVAVRIRMTVINSGAVEKAAVLSGPKNKTLRSCLSGIVKGLTFPPFQGPKVSQTVPFTMVRRPSARTP